MGFQKIKFRFATRADYKELVDFHKDRLSQNSLRNILSRHDIVKVAIAESGHILGKALLYILPWTAGKKKAKRAMIAEVFVQKEYRNRGIATGLVKFCIQEAKKLAEDIQIDRVELENKTAIRIYKKQLPKRKIVFTN